MNESGDTHSSERRSVDSRPQSDDTDLESDPNTSDILPACPSCETPVANVTIVGPTEAVAGPCGCRVPPDLLERERDE